MLTAVRILEIVSFLDLLAAGLIVPQLPPQARNLGGNHILIGLMGALYSGFQLLSNPLIGSLSDIKGRSTVLLLSLSLSGVAYTLLGVTSSIVLFLGLRVVLGITKHTQLLTKALTPEFTKDKNQLSEIYGRLNALKQAGMAVGPIIGGHIVATFPENGFTIIAFLVGAIFAINSGLIRRLPEPESEKKKEKENNKEDSKDKEDLPSTLLNSVSTNVKGSVDQFYQIDWNTFREVFLFKFLISICIGVYITNYVLFLKIKYGMSPIGLGYVISLFSIVGSLTSIFISHINKFYANDKDYTIRNLHVFMVLFVSLVGVMLAPTVAIYVVFILPLGISSTVGSLVTQEVILCKAKEEQRGTVLGVATNIRALSGVIAPLISGVVGQYIGVLSVVYVSVILAAIGAYKSYVVVKLNALKEKTK